MRGLPGHGEVFWGYVGVFQGSWRGVCGGFGGSTSTKGPLTPLFDASRALSYPYELPIHPCSGHMSAINGLQIALIPSFRPGKAPETPLQDPFCHPKGLFQHLNLALEARSPCPEGVEKYISGLISGGKRPKRAPEHKPPLFRPERARCSASRAEKHYRWPLNTPS